MSYYHVYAPLSHQAFKMLGAVIGRVKRPSVNRGFLYGPLLATPGVGVTGITCGTWSMKPKVCDGPIESGKSWVHRSPCAFATPSKQMSCHITKIYAFPKELLFIYYGANVMILSGQCSRIFPPCSLHVVPVHPIQTLPGVKPGHTIRGLSAGIGEGAWRSIERYLELQEP